MPEQSRRRGISDIQARVAQNMREDRERRQSAFEEEEARYRAAGYSWRRWPVHGDPRRIESRDHKSCGLVVSDAYVHDNLCPANGRGRQEPMLDGSSPPSS